MEQSETAECPAKRDCVSMRAHRTNYESPAASGRGSVGRPTGGGGDGSASGTLLEEDRPARGSSRYRDHRIGGKTDSMDTYAR